MQEYDNILYEVVEMKKKEMEEIISKKLDLIAKGNLRIIKTINENAPYFYFISHRKCENNYLINFDFLHIYKSLKELMNDHVVKEGGKHNEKVFIRDFQKKETFKINAEYIYADIDKKVLYVVLK